MSSFESLTLAATKLQELSNLEAYCLGHAEPRPFTDQEILAITARISGCAFNTVKVMFVMAFLPQRRERMRRHLLTTGSG